jgi:hypothetical protein
MNHFALLFCPSDFSQQQNEGKIPILLQFCTSQNLTGKMAAKMNHFAHF